MKGTIHVTRSFLPPREEFEKWLDKIYESHVLTNNGPIHRELEESLRQRFDVPFLRLMTNGTLAIQLAIRALGVTGKIITTPFSYVATTSAILWEGCEPIFVDIDPNTCCIDAALIESAITPDTTAILATHVYGIPCDVEAIDVIAKKHGLKVIYDAAHAFDVKYKGRSILSWGDASTLSFHATKLFHTVEGGAVILNNKEADDKLRLLRSFGHIGDEHFCLGMNAKMSEVHAAMGMAVLPHVERIIEERKKICELYNELLDHGIGRLGIPDQVEWNYAYYPITLKSATTRVSVTKSLESNYIVPRRYFYPSLDMLPYVDSSECKESRSISDRVLSLPLYAGLGRADISRIAEVVNKGAMSN